MRQWMLPVVLLVVVIGGALSILMDTEDPGDQGTTEVSRTEGNEPSQPTSTDDQSQEPPTAPEASGVPTSKFTEQDGSAAPDAAPIETVPVEVYKVDPQSGEESVVPGVDVYFLRFDSTIMQKVQEAVRGGLKIEDVARKFGQPFRTGSDGRTSVPAKPRRSGLFVMTDGFMGTETTGRDNDLIRIRLKPLTMIPARVVTQAGDPVTGLQVTVTTEDGVPLGMAPMGTDKNGLAQCHLDTGRLARLPGTPSALVSVLAPFSAADAKAVSKKVDLSALPTEPVTLVMPPVGSMVIKIDAPDAWRDEGTFVFIRPHQEDGNSAKSMHQFMGETWHEAVSGRTARFPFVGLGTRWDIALNNSHAGVEAEVSDVAGPTREGEEVEVVLHPKQIKPVVKFRVVDEDGAPRSGLELELEFFQNSESSSSSSSRSIRTDNDGVVETALPYGWKPSETRTLVVALGNGDRAGDLTNAHRMDLSREIPAGVTDLGDVRLRPAPTFVSGLLVDESGSPVAGARATLKRQIIHRMPRHEGKVHAYWSYSSVGSGPVITDNEGRFEIRTFTPPKGMHRIVFAKAGLRQEQPTEFEPGTTGLRITLRGAGRVHARVLLPDGFRAADLRFRLEPQEGTNPGSRDAPISGRMQDGIYKCEAVAPGTYDLTVNVSLDIQGEPFMRLPGLTVRAGEVCPDPRLDPVDLRGQLKACNVIVVDTAGKPVDRPEITLISGERTRRQRAGRDGQCRLVLPTITPGVRVRVSKDGFQDVLVDELRPVLRIVLDPAPRVRIRLSADARASLNDRGLSVTLHRREAPAGTPKQRSTTVHLEPGDDDVYVSVPAPGRYRLRWVLWEITGPRARSGRNVDTAKIQTVEIFSGDRDRLIIAEITSQDIRKTYPDK